MYLTQGQFKGRKIEVPNRVRPTLSKVRESIFNILNCMDFNKKEVLFLDMFAGSGIMGLEAISNGYKVKELEINLNSIKVIKNNYEKLGLKADITKVNSLKYQTEDRYDIIYIDPPWDYEYAEIIEKAASLAKKDGIIIIEYDKTKNIDINKILNEVKHPLTIVKSKKYGRVMLDFLKLL